LARRSRARGPKALAAQDDFLLENDRVHVVIDAIAQRLQNADLSDVTINYHLDKAVTDPWNMLVGASYEFNKRWQARVEPGFIGRKQLLAQVNYRFNW